MPFFKRLSLKFKTLCYSVFLSRSPAMILTDLDHGGQNVIPDLLAGHDVVGKHAAVPADMFELLRHLPFVVPHPIPSIPRNIQFAARIGDHAMTSGFIMRA